jgi:hypothetical protein
MVEEAYKVPVGGQDAILIMLWCQNEGGTVKTFSRKDATLHYLPAAIKPGTPPLPF